MNTPETFHTLPSRPFPGMLAVFVPSTQFDLTQRLESNADYDNYSVHAIISESIPLSFNVSEFIKIPSSSLLSLAVNPITLTMHHGGYNAIFYDLVSKSNGELSHIEVELKAKYPAECFGTARTLVNQFLDRLMREIWVPLTIIRLDIYLKGENEPLMHQLIYPFNIRINMNPTGGYDTYSLFSSYEALIREAINTTSPYYRFLCAYRLSEGIKYLRHEIRKLCEQLGVANQMPKPPTIEPNVIAEFGFGEEFSEKITSMDILISEFTVWRNSVAHFLTKTEKSALNFSHGDNYRTYSMGSALLLHYAHISFIDLFVFFNQEVNSKIRRGSILPLEENRDMFVIKADSWRNAFTDTEN